MPAVLIEAPTPTKLKLAPEQRAAVADYIRARRAAAAANAVIENLKDSVLSIVNMNGGRIMMLDAFVLRGQSVSYAYPKAILNKEAKLRQEKKIMQLDGRAEKVVKDCLQFEDLEAKEKNL